MIKRILVGLGGTPFTPVAVEQAIELAMRHDASVTGVTVVDFDRLTHVGAGAIGAGGAAEELREHRLTVSRERIGGAIEQFESACREAGIRYEVDRERGDAFQQYGELARYHDLMIFGMKSLFDCGLGLEATDAMERLLMQGVRPVLAVSDHHRPIKRVLMAYSGSPESAKTIKRFIHLRPWDVVWTKLLTCGPDATEARTLLDDMASFCRDHGFDPETEHRNESPRRAILDAAKACDADLIVMGSSGRSYLMRKLFGETAMHVIEKADRPLFLSY